MRFIFALYSHPPTQTQTQPPLDAEMSLILLNQAIYNQHACIRIIGAITTSNMLSMIILNNFWVDFRCKLNLTTGEELDEFNFHLVHQSTH